MSTPQSVPDAAEAPSAPPRPRDWADLIADMAVAIAAVALVALVAVQGWQVFARYVLNDSPSWIEPVTVALLTTAMAFGAAAGVHANRHFAFTLLAGATAGRLRMGIALAQRAVVALIGGIVAWWATRLFLDGLDVHAAGAPLPETLPFAPVALGALCMTLLAIAQMLRIATGREAS